MPATDYCCPSCEGGFPEPADKCPWCGEAMSGRSGPTTPAVADPLGISRLDFDTELEPGPDIREDRIEDRPEEPLGGIRMDLPNARFERAVDRLNDDGGNA